MSLRTLQAGVLSRHTFEWIKNQDATRRHSHTDLGLYTYDFTVCALDAANPSDVDLTTVCQPRRQPYQPAHSPNPDRPIAKSSSASKPASDIISAVSRMGRRLGTATLERIVAEYWSGTPTTALP